jgi:hypothetical protein
MFSCVLNALFPRGELCRPYPNQHSVCARETGWSTVYLPLGPGVEPGRSCCQATATISGRGRIGWPLPASFSCCAFHFEHFPSR